MNSYETRQAQKKAYYAEKASRLETEAARLSKYHQQKLSVIPLGQPILIGHHSAKRHRADIKRSHKRLYKIFELEEKAEYYHKRATVENRAISSDDPDALIKLKNKLFELEENQKTMRRVNSEYRKGGIEAITGFSEETKAALKIKIDKAYSWEKKPFASYKLSNNNAEIRRLKQRIAELEASQKETPRETIHGDGYTVTENKEDNRIWIEFEQKPVREICALMREYGFKWSHTRSAWVRMLNQFGRNQAQRVIQKIEPLMEKVA